jgi:hypothetical protein
MTLTLNLSQEEEQRLRALAVQQGTDAQEVVLQAVRKMLPPQTVSDRIAALRTLLEDDEEEQRETGEYLQHALDEDRLSFRKLYS